MRRLPKSLWACVAIGVLNALTWALITPSFQVVDEPSHAGYVQYLAETGRPPQPSPLFEPSPDLRAALEAAVYDVNGDPPWSPIRDAQSDRRLEERLGRVSEFNAAPATNNPPLFYAIQTIPYSVLAGSSPLDRLFGMRLVSVLLFGFTVAFVFLFVREVLPRRPWAAPVGALVVALQPVAAWLGGGVSIDALLFAVSACILYLLARGLRRGLDVRLGVALGLAVAAGLLTKGTTLGLVPGVAVGVGLMAWRARREGRPGARRAAAVAAVCAIVPFALWLVVNAAVFDRPASTNSGNLSNVANEADPSIREAGSYVWQFYLPRLPFMQDKFVEYPLWFTYFQGFVGRLGFAQYAFPTWVFWLALAATGLLGALLARELARRRQELRERWPELVTYATLLLGLLAAIHTAGYLISIRDPRGFEQPRYLFPLLGLYAVMAALAARGAGRRLAPAAAAAIVMLVLAQNLFAQLLTIARYYA